MKKCSKCGFKMIEKLGKTPEGFEYKYYSCGKCGEEIVDMKQLHNLAEEYRNMKKYEVSLSKWGLSLGLRIPKELVNKYKLNEKDKIFIIPEKNGILIINEKNK